MLTPLVVGAEAITVDGAYARASSKLAKSAAAFMEIKNMSSTEDRLLVQDQTLRRGLSYTLTLRVKMV